ncbi:hypothetical protein EDC56_2209 [Sinobacterium caligoides]|uniref:Uncharacterized protein n=1 Tax=Sinobacterium caligoides TaxID=933926 RepID=A0A3N2DPL4_9GAMM|nr:hypothetical protein [Sinobacterium caligoides]ROS01764.1 hypothetical protein EDC56_2209 [Sinobacterium caligoides]
MKKIILTAAVMAATLAATTASAQSSLLDEVQSGSNYKNTNFNAQVYQIDDDYDTVAAFTANVQVNDALRMSAQLDTEGYMEVSAGYGFAFNNGIYLEPYANYGKTDFLDIYSLGAFSGLAITEKLMMFADVSHQWRNGRDIGDVYDASSSNQRELLTAIGASYDLLDSLNASYTFHYDNVIEDGGMKNESDSRTSHEINLTYSGFGRFEPYVQYTTGEYRVSEGAQVSNEESVEFGFNYRF